METEKIETFSAHIHKAGLDRVKGQFHPDHQLLNHLQRFLGLLFGTADNYKIIGVSHKFAQGDASFFPVHVQHMQIDVRQQGANHTTLWRSRLRSTPTPIFQHARFQPLPDEFQHSPVADPPFYQPHQ
jgi:hypothetical protein